MVEKPFSRSLPAARDVCILAERLGQPLDSVAMMGHIPAHSHARRLIDDRRVDFQSPQGKFNLGYVYVGPLEAGTIHLFDLCRFSLGDVTEVYAVAVNAYGDHRQRYPFDNLAIALGFASGAVGSFVSSPSALSLKPCGSASRCTRGNRGWLSIISSS
jgi:predicted dehydrogenase